MKNSRFVKKLIKGQPLPHPLKSCISILETTLLLCDYVICECSLSCFAF